MLIVERDPAEQRALGSILVSLGHPIVVAASACEARGWVLQQDFAVILLDLRSPDVDGFETAAFIRSRPESAGTPIVLVTTIDRAEHEMTIGYAMGAVDFVVAPVVPAALRGKVSLFADLYAKNQELLEGARRLRVAATRSSEAFEFQLEMLDRMEQLGRAKSEFISKISHELRSPLTSVIGYVELLSEGGPGEPTAEQGRMYSIIERNSRRLLVLIEDLLTMSRVEAGTFALRVGPVDLAAVIEHVRETIAPAATNAQLDLVVHRDAAAGLVGDGEQIERAVLNLVSNAVKFTAPTGVVEIATRVADDHVVISVRDTGFGIPNDEQEHLFTRFFRTTRSQEQQVPGTGLGLYLVKQIVQLHGGSITVESTPGGSTFTMRLPLAGPPADPLALVRKV